MTAATTCARPAGTVGQRTSFSHGDSRQARGQLAIKRKLVENEPRLSPEGGRSPTAGQPSIIWKTDKPDRQAWPHDPSARDSPCWARIVPSARRPTGGTYPDMGTVLLIHRVLNRVQLHGHSAAVAASRVPRRGQSKLRAHRGARRRPAALRTDDATSAGSGGSPPAGG